MPEPGRFSEASPPKASCRNTCSLQTKTDTNSATCAHAHAQNEFILPCTPRTNLWKKNATGKENPKKDDRESDAYRHKISARRGTSVAAVYITKVPDTRRRESAHKTEHNKLSLEPNSQRIYCTVSTTVSMEERLTSAPPLPSVCSSSSPLIALNFPTKNALPPISPYTHTYVNCNNLAETLYVPACTAVDKNRRFVL